MHSRSLVIAIYLLLSSETTFAANILITTGTNYGSHFSVLSTVGRALGDRGHTITALISDAYAEKANDPQNSLFRFEVFSDSEPDLTREWSDTFAKYLMEKKSSTFGTFHWMPPTVWPLIKTCEDMIDYFIEKELHYDLFLLDAHSPCSVFLAGYLRIPYVLLVPSGIKPSLARRHGVTDTSSYYPEMSTGLSYRMGFFDRVSNMFTGMSDDIAMFFAYEGLAYLLGFRYSTTTPATKLVSSSQLILINTDFAVDFPFPLLPNVVTVGGLTTRPGKPLSKEWQEFMDDSGKNGAIIFTLGTYAGSVMSLTEMEKLAKAFAVIPQRVIWQMKNDPPASLQVPDNTRIVSWMPQNDLLAHPNLKVLVFHGGNNGMYEALYHGVPMVVMPLIYDHPDVAARVVDREMGVMVDYFDFTSEDIINAVNTVIENPKYRENAKRVSAIFRANPQPPLERAVYWIEHVLRFGGDYLRSSRTDLYIWQVYSIDVYVFLLLVIYLTYRAVKFFFEGGYHRRVLGFLWQCVRFPFRRLFPRFHLTNSFTREVTGKVCSRFTGGSGKSWAANGIGKV